MTSEPGKPHQHRGETAPRATIAIPVFNSAETLPRCLRSAMGQTLKNIEILVADDGSTDMSADIAATFAAVDPRIRLIRMGRNGGKSRAMNRMIQQARGEWFAVLDADDRYCPDRINRLIAAAEATGVEMAADNILYVDSGVGRVMQTAFPRDTPERIITKIDLAKNSDPFSSFDFGSLKPVLRRDFALAQGLYYFEDARLSEDFYYILKFFVAGGRACIVSEPLYEWTMPFGPISRRWTQTGNGAWRYDYRNACEVNRHFLAEMVSRNEPQMAAMLRVRQRRYVSMVHYVDAQRAAAEGRVVAAALGVLGHPSTYRLLLRRMPGICARLLRGAIGSSSKASCAYD